MVNNDFDLQSYLPQDLEQRILNGNYNRQIYPAFTDRAAWEKTLSSPERQLFKKAVLKNADNILNEPIPMITLEDYILFKLNGNRSIYQKPYFQRRESVGTLAMALGMTGNKDKYLLPIINYLWAIIEERNWCLHAHACYDSEDIYPNDAINRKRVDLFAASTSSVIALVLNVCGEEIRKFSPNIYEVIVNETLERTVMSVVNYEGPYLCFYRGSGNWNAWCTTNMFLSCFVLLDDPVKLIRAMRKLISSMNVFITASADDGYCDEGPVYWSKAAGFMTQFFMELDKIFPGASDKTMIAPKIQALIKFPMSTVCGTEYQYNFSDNLSRPRYEPGNLYYSGIKMHSEEMLRFAATWCKAWREDEERCKHLENNGEGIRFSLAYLFDIPADIDVSTAFENDKDTLFENRLSIFRMKDSFTAILKAGDNDEHHNHNDLGHFSLFRGNTPVVIDLGTNRYTAKSFSAERYSIIFHGAHGHNAPVFNGKMQQHGKEYTAALTIVENTPSKKVAMVDLGKAYPEDAGVTAFTRTQTLTPEECRIRDRIGSGTPMPAAITLFTPIPVVKNGNKLKFDNAAELDIAKFECEITPFESDDINIVHSWGKNISRIMLKTSSTEYDLVFKKL